jgi:hypothetical protein
VTFGADVQPQESLSVFAGTSAAGIWSLQVIDVAGDDVGRVLSWDLILHLEGSEQISSRPVDDGSRLIIPAVGHSGTADGRFVESDLLLTNASAATTTVDMFFTPYDADGRSDFRVMRVTIGPWESIEIDDVVNHSFFAAGVGTLEVFGHGGALTAVTRSRTAVGSAKTAQTIPSLVARQIANRSEKLTLPRIRMNELYRTNVGFTNGGETAARVEVRFHSVDGTELESVSLTIPPFSGTMRPAADNAAYAVADVREGTSVGAFSSVIKRDEGDAAFFGAHKMSEVTMLTGAAITARGANETWTSPLTLTNLSSDEVQVTLRFANDPPKVLTMAAREQISFEDVVREVFEHEQRIGARVVEARAPIAVALETAGRRADGERRERFLMASARQGSEAVFPLLPGASGARSNAGVANGGPSVASVAFELRDTAAKLVSIRFGEVLSGEVFQIPLVDLPAGVAGVTIRPIGEHEQLVPYVSSIDSFDALTQAGSPSP